MIESPYIPVYQLTRGNITESIHYGAVAVVDSAGKLIASAGNPNGVSFLRSTAKPFQALPLLEAGAIDHFGFTPKQIALMCASHSGTDVHVETVLSIQELGGFTEQDLLCGVHYPYHAQTTADLRAQGETPTENRHNCSGKHSGMLAFAKLLGAPTENYLDLDHPVQRAILNTFADMAGVPVAEVALGVDGCSAPNFAVSFQRAAFAFARLVNPVDLAETRATASRTLVSAMIAHPDMVAGPDRFDTALMQIGNGKIVSKGGAEGYQGIGLLPGALGLDSPAMGIAIKISDGDLRKTVTAAVATEVLHQLGALNDTQLAALSAFGPQQDVLNWRKLVVGNTSAIFNLVRH